MHGYVDPFAHRFARSRPTDEPDVEDEHDEDETNDGSQIGPEAIVEDAEHARREAPFADDPRRRVRPG